MHPRKHEGAAEKAEAATRTSRAPRSTPHCVHPSNEHPRTVKDRFEPFPRRAGCEVPGGGTT